MADDAPGGKRVLSLFARTPGRNIFGKFDDKLPEIRVPFEVRQDVERVAHEDGLDVTSWLRELVFARLYGPDHVGSLYAERARRVLGNAGQSTQIGDAGAAP